MAILVKSDSARNFEDVTVAMAVIPRFAKRSNRRDDAEPAALIGSWRARFKHFMNELLRRRLFIKKAAPQTRPRRVPLSIWTVSS